MSTLPFTNFTKGEIAPELQARIDTNQYGAGAKKVRNFIIQRYGGLSFRPGFRLVAEADSIYENVAYIPFQYNIEQAYIMALGNERMRLLAGGGTVAEENVQITGITNSANAQVTVPYHAYEIGDRIHFSGITGMDEINGQFATVLAVPDANTIVTNLNTTDFGAFTSSDGTLRVGPPPAPPAPPAPPPTPPDPPVDPDLPGGGGSGGGSGGVPWWKLDYQNRDS